MNNLEEIIFSFKITVIAYVYSVILTEAGMILNPLWIVLDKLIGKYPFIFKPIIDCYRCVTGQFVLWTYLILVWMKQISFSFFELTYLICLSIIISIIINYFYDRIKAS